MIGENIKQKLKEKRMHVSELSQRVGIPASTIYSYLSNVRMPSADALKKIAEGLHTTADDLLKEPEPSYPNVEKIMSDPTARASFEKMMVKWSQLPEEAKKSVDEYIAFVLEQNKKK